MKTLAIMLLAVLMPGLAPAMAAEPAAGRHDVQRMAQGGGLTLDQAVEQVRRQYNGRIVSAETRVSGNRETHYIKVLLEDGKVKTVAVRGRTVGKG